MDRDDITPSVVECLIESQFPQWAGLAVERVESDGWDNTTYRLGREMSVRLPSADIYSAQVDKEHRWLPYLSERLPLPIPEPVAKGVPGCEFPRPWSVYRWLPGERATVDNVADLCDFARSLAAFLTALHAVPTAGGPPPGRHNFSRGGPLATYDAQTRETVELLADDIDVEAVMNVWEAGLSSSWEREPVWLHGDVTASNLLVVAGRLSAVIDFGTMAAGDPACDLGIAWTFFEDSSRAVFREAVGFDDASWARARGWTLWKAPITHAEATPKGRPAVAAAGRQFGWRYNAREVIEQLIAAHAERGT